jgi:8-amino-7-oxononanoate synthase
VTADFTSALILGLTHPSESLSWTELTTGTPAALRRSDLAVRAAREFATLVGCEAALVASSTLHAFSDLFGQVWRPPAMIFHDDAIYPIARWEMERAEQQGARVISFRHLDPDDLEQRLRQATTTTASAAKTTSVSGLAPPWVVTDGFCAGCARPAPLDAYAAVVRRWGGLLVIDDAQAIGLHGRAPTAVAPYGRGGGGSLSRFRLPREAPVVLVASLAKAFGAPLAMVAGTRSFIDTFTTHSETQVHCSPPPIPTLAAARRALELSATDGDALRARLARRVQQLRRALRARDITVRPGLFPMQRVRMPNAATAIAMRDALEQRGVRVVVRRSRCNDEVSLTFIVTARHGEEEIHSAAVALAAVARRFRRSLTPVRSNLEA